METRTSMTVIQVTKICDKCDVGTMTPTGMTLTSYPPKYPHICDACGSIETFDKTYPYTELLPEGSIKSDIHPDINDDK